MGVVIKTSTKQIQEFFISLEDILNINYLEDLLGELIKVYTQYPLIKVHVDTMYTLHITNLSTIPANRITTILLTDIVKREVISELTLENSYLSQPTVRSIFKDLFLLTCV